MRTLMKFGCGWRKISHKIKYKKIPRVHHNAGRNFNAFQKKLWYFLSILSTLLLVVLPISGCNSSFNVESTTETRTYTSTITNNSDKNTSDTSQSDNSSTASSKKKQIDETDDYLNKNGSYTSKEDVTNYLIQYRQLPTNFITKKEAKKTGLVRRKLRSLCPRQMYRWRLFRQL